MSILVQAPEARRQQRHQWPAQLPRGRDQHPAAVFTAIGALHMPESAAVIKACAGHFPAGVNAGPQSVSIRTMPQVTQNVVARREGARPVEMPFKGKGIQMGRYIARSAGITVLAPHAADVVGFFQQYEIRAPSLL